MKNVCWDFNWKYFKYPTIYSAHPPKLANYLGYFWEKNSHLMSIVYAIKVCNSRFLVFYIYEQGAGIGKSRQPPGLTNYHNLTVNSRSICESLSFKFLQRKGKEVFVGLPRKNNSGASKFESSIHEWMRQWI